MENKTSLSHEDECQNIQGLSESDSDVPKRSFKSVEDWLAIIGLVLGYIASQQLGNQAAALMTTINADLGPKDWYYWITGSGLLAGAAGWVYAGPLSDQYGRRPIVLLGNCLALIGAIVGASAQHLYVVIIGLIIAGLGSGGQVQAVVVLSESFRNKDRAWVQALLYLTTFPFIATGQAVAIAIGLHSTWRWIFYLNIILTALSLILITLFFSPPRKQEVLESEKVWKKPISWRHLDVVSIILMAMFVTGIGIAALWGGFGKYKWNTAATLVPLFLGITSMVLLWPQSQLFAQNAFYPHTLFQNLRGFAFLFFATALSAFALASMNLIYPEEITALFTMDATKAARYQFTSGFGAELGVLAAGITMRHVGRTNLILTAAAFFVVLFVGLMASVTPDNIKPALAYTTLGQFSGGCIKILVFVSVTLDIPEVLIGTALGVLNLAWSFGPAFALGSYLTIMESRVAATFVRNVEQAVLPLGLPLTSLPALLEAITSGSQISLMKVPGISLPIIEAAIQATKHTYFKSFQIVWFVGMAAGVLALPFAFFTRDVRPQMDDRKAVEGLADGSTLQWVKNKFQK